MAEVTGLLNRDGSGASLQASFAKEIAYNGADYFNNVGFQIKIEGTVPLTMTVIYAGEKKNDGWVATTFFPGWNPDLVRAIQYNTLDSSKFKVG
jgi:hypothetical protein